MHVTRHLEIVGRLAILAIVLGAGGVVRGQELWTGNIGDDQWTTGGNWLDGTAPLGSVGAQIIFGTDLLGRYTVNGADTPFTDIAGIAFTLASGSYTISGTGSFSFDQGTGITNDSLFAQTINVDLIGMGTGMTISADGADITLDSLDTGLTIDLSDSGGVLLSINGNNDTFIYNEIVGVNGALAKTGNGTLTLYGTNTYDGPTSLFSGTVIAANDMAFGNSDVLVSGTAIIESDDDAAQPRKRRDHQLRLDGSRRLQPRAQRRHRRRRRDHQVRHGDAAPQRHEQLLGHDVHRRGRAPGQRRDRRRDQRHGRGEPLEQGRHRIRASRRRDDRRPQRRRRRRRQRQPQRQHADGQPAGRCDLFRRHLRRRRPRDVRRRQPPARGRQHLRRRHGALRHRRLGPG